MSDEAIIQCPTCSGSGVTKCLPAIGKTGAAVTGLEPYTSTDSGDNVCLRLVGVAAFPQSKNRLRRPEPCPFCGGGAKLAPTQPKGFMLTVDHIGRCAIGHLRSVMLTSEEQIELWNARAKDSCHD